MPLQSLPVLTELKDMLQKGVCKIEFTKLNGDNRIILCTRQSGLIAETVGKSRNIPEDMLVVTDIDKNEWRSFNYDQIISVQYLGDN